MLVKPVETRRCCYFTGEMTDEMFKALKRLFTRTRNRVTRNWVSDRAAVLAHKLICIRPVITRGNT